MKNLFTLSFAVAAAIVAYLYATNPLLTRHFITLVTFGKLPGFHTFGESCDSTPIMSVDKSSRFGKDKHCFNETGGLPWFDAQHNVSMTEQLLLHHVDIRCPVVIRRPFADHKCLERLKNLASANPNHTVRVKSNQERYLNENMLFPDSDKWVQANLNRNPTRQTLESFVNELESGPSMKFSAFENSLGTKEYENIFGTDLGYIKGQMGTTFFSHYNKTVITTPFHSAFAEYFGYQCEGTKKWYLLTPDDALPTVRFHAHATVMKDCNGRKDIEANLITTVTEPDTMFYFPPFWAHSVETKKGFSVLLNYRSRRTLQMMQSEFMPGLISIVGLFYQVVFFSAYSIDEIATYYNSGLRPTTQHSDRTLFTGIKNIISNTMKSGDTKSRN